MAVVFYKFAKQRGCTIIKKSIVPNYVHILISVAPKYLAIEVVSYIKRKSYISVVRQFGDKKNLTEKTLGKGSAVSTVGFEENQIKSYIKRQEQLDGLG
ncbi:MAG: transposase [Alphaproteobacteria bacterium]|nr:transposase [Alphaproteobacteria bacterium]